MKRLLSILLILGALAAATWFALSRRPAVVAPEAAAAQPRYDFEADGVVIRQMDAEGSLQYEVEAERVVQLPQGGEIRATGIVLHRDPRGSQPGGAQRWRLTADEATLPANGRSVLLSGQVRAEGTPAGGRAPLRFSAGELRYDIDQEQAVSPGRVDFSFGGNRFSGTGLRVDVATGVVALESVIHGTFSR